MINFHNYYETQQPNRKEIESEISGFLVKIDNILTIECQPSRYKRDTELAIICYVNKTEVMFLFNIFLIFTKNPPVLNLKRI